MQAILTDIKDWLTRGHSVALATLVATEGSSPREVGAVLAVNDRGAVVGSLSSGCVESVIVEVALAVIASGEAQLLTFGEPEDEFAIGLTCGGTMQVFVEHLVPEYGELTLAELLLATERATTEPVAICTRLGSKPTKCIVLTSGSMSGSLGDANLDMQIRGDAQSLLALGESRQVVRGCEAATSIFVASLATPPHLLIFGAVEFARALCQLGRPLGYRTTVCDARSRFATKARFPEADQLEVLWPHAYFERYGALIDARTVIVVLSHDPKFDVPALTAAVKTPAHYIGALGSRRAQAERHQRLVDAGLSESDLARIAAPTGLDLGARTAAETAISILAEVIALRHGRQGGRLSSTQTPIHARTEL
ncbi:MAG: XdhC family protein [Synechococcaceae cyanobacterium SM2_3_60]|nr:XdhC family protein [Synechococcaceae cyanobacterium SM2_3_60]